MPSSSPHAGPRCRQPTPDGGVEIGRGDGRQARRGWDAAGDYDAWFETRWGRYAFPVEAGLVRAAVGEVTGRQVLEAGCGTGRFGQTLADAGATVSGLDRSAAMVAIAAQRLAAVVVGDAHRLPFAGGTFAATVAVAVLEFVADPAVVVAEMARVTASDGAIVLGALNPDSPWGWAHRRALGRPPWVDARFLTPEELAAMGRRHGDVQAAQGLYAPGWLPGLDRWGGVLERLGHLLPVAGALQVVRIRRR